MSNNKSNQALKIGDTVQLKSGGPIITVNKIEENGEIYCKWFAGEHFDKVYHDYFQPDTLQLIDKPNKKGTAFYKRS